MSHANNPHDQTPTANQDDDAHVNAGSIISPRRRQRTGLSPNAIQERLQHSRQRSAVLRPVANLKLSQRGVEEEQHSTNKADSVQAAGSSYATNNARDVGDHADEATLVDEIMAAFEGGDVEALARMECGYGSTEPVSSSTTAPPKAAKKQPQGASRETPVASRVALHLDPFAPIPTSAQLASHASPRNSPQGVTPSFQRTASQPSSRDSSPNRPQLAPDPFAQLPEGSADYPKGTPLRTWDTVRPSGVGLTAAPDVGAEANAAVRKAQLAALVSASTSAPVQLIASPHAQPGTSIEMGETCITELPQNHIDTKPHSAKPTLFNRLFGRSPNKQATPERGSYPHSSPRPIVNEDQNVFDSFVRSSMYNRYEREIVYQMDMLRRSNALNDDQYDFALVVCDKVIGAIPENAHNSTDTNAGPVEAATAKPNLGDHAASNHTNTAITTSETKDTGDMARTSFSVSLSRHASSVGHNPAGNGMTEAVLDGEVTNLAETLLDHHSKTWRAAHAAAAAAVGTATDRTHTDTSEDRPSTRDGMPLGGLKLSQPRQHDNLGSPSLKVKKETLNQQTIPEAPLALGIPQNTDENSIPKGSLLPLQTPQRSNRAPPSIPARPPPQPTPVSPPQQQGARSGRRAHRRSSMVLAGTVRRDAMVPEASSGLSGSPSPPSEVPEGDSEDGAFELQRDRLRKVLLQAALHRKDAGLLQPDSGNSLTLDVHVSTQKTSESARKSPVDVTSILERLPTVASARARNKLETGTNALAALDELRLKRGFRTPRRTPAEKTPGSGDEHVVDPNPPQQGHSFASRMAHHTELDPVDDGEAAQMDEMHKQQRAVLSLLEQKRAKRTKQMLTLPRTLVARSPGTVAGAGAEGGLAASIELANLNHVNYSPNSREQDGLNELQRSVVSTYGLREAGEEKHFFESMTKQVNTGEVPALPPVLMAMNGVKLRKIHERVRKASSVLVQERLESAGLLVKREALKLTEEEGWQAFPCTCCRRPNNDEETSDTPDQKPDRISRRLVLLKVCAPAERLEIEAEAMRLNMRLRKGGHCPFERSIRDAFLGTADPSCLFRSSQRQFILDRIIRSPQELGGANLTEGSPLGKAIIDRFPLHMYARLAGLAHWVKPWRHATGGGDDYTGDPTELQQDGPGDIESGADNGPTGGLPITTAIDESVGEQLPQEDLPRRKKRGAAGCFRRTVSITLGLFNQPLDAIADYFGEQIAFYFAWLEFYTKWLVVPAIAGLLLTIHVALWSPSVSEGSSILQVSSLDSPYIPAYSALLAIWSVLMIRCWERRAAELAYRWGVLGYEENDEQLRPEFKGQLRLHPLKKMVLRHYPVWRRALKMCISVPTLIVLVAAPCLFVLWLFSAYDDALKRNNLTGGFDGLGTFNEPILFAPILWGAFVPIYDECYTFLANKLNNWENWAKHSTHQKSFIAKVFSLRFLNSFLVLYYFAFADMGVMRISTSLASFLIMGTISQYIINLSIPAFLRWRSTNALKRQAGKEVLRLFVIKATRLFRAKLDHDPALRRELVSTMPGAAGMGEEDIETKLTKISRQHAHAAGQGLTENAAVLSRFLTQAWVESRRPNHDSFREHAMLIIQYGYVVLFSATLPLAPFIVLVKNLFDIRTGAWKLCNLTKRPIAAKSSGIGVWLDVVRLLSFVSALTNTVLIAFASKQLDNWFTGRTITLSDRLLFVFVCEHAFLVLSWAFDRILPSIPAHIRYKVDHERKELHKQQARHHHTERDRLLRKKELDAERLDDHGTGFLGSSFDKTNLRSPQPSRFLTIA